MGRNIKKRSGGKTGRGVDGMRGRREIRTECKKAMKSCKNIKMVKMKMMFEGWWNQGDYFFQEVVNEERWKKYEALGGRVW